MQELTGFSVHVPDAYLVGGDGSRVIRAVSDATGAPVLLAAPGARGAFCAVPLPAAGGWAAPRVCAWSPAGGVLGGVVGDTSCVLAVGSGPRALLCARAAALRACLQTGLAGPAGGAWEPPDAPAHAAWAVLPLDVAAGEDGDTFTALAWAPRLYRHAAGARSYLALGSAAGQLQLLRLSSFCRDLWPAELPPLPCAGVLGGSGALESMVVARSKPAGGGRGLASLAWVGRKGVALGWGDGAVSLVTVEAREGANDWDGGAIVSPATRLLPPNGAPAVALRYEAGCLAAARGAALSFAWPAGDGGGGGGEGGGGGGGVAGQPPGARPRWRVTEEAAAAQARAVTVENAHDGCITGVHLVSSAPGGGGGGGGAVAYTASLDGSVRSWTARAAPGWLPGGARPPLMRLVDAGGGGAGGALGAGREAGAPPPPPSLRASPLYGLAGDAGALALAALTCAPAAVRAHAPPARGGALAARARAAAAAAAEAAHAPERRLAVADISLLPFPSLARLAGAPAPEGGGASGFGALGEALALALGALEGGAARVGRGVAAEGPGALLCPPGPDDAGDRDVAALCCALERYGDAAAAAARAAAAGFASGAWARKPGWGAPTAAGDVQAEAAAWLVRRDGGGGAAAAAAAAGGAGDGAPAPEVGGGGGGGGEEGAAPSFFRPVFAADRRNPGAPTTGALWVPRPPAECVGGERAEWYAPFSPSHLFSAARGGCSPPAAAATAAALASLRDAAAAAPLHASLQALLPLFLLRCAASAQAAPRGAAAPHLRIALQTCHHVLHTALEALLARHGPAPGGGGGGGGGAPSAAGGSAPPSAALPGGDALPGVAFLSARRRLARAPALPPRWAWHAAAVAPRLYLWLRCEELRLVSLGRHTRCEANNDAWKAALAVARAALGRGAAAEEGAAAEGATDPLLEPALLAELLAWQPKIAGAPPPPPPPPPPAGGAAGWAEPIPAQPLSHAATWLAPEVALALPPTFLLAQALEACGGALRPRW
jgi:hypothetical protein